MHYWTTNRILTLLNRELESGTWGKLVAYQLGCTIHFTVQMHVDYKGMWRS